jgi:hypothetical protein
VAGLVGGGIGARSWTTYVGLAVAVIAILGWIERRRATIPTKPLRRRSRTRLRVIQGPKAPYDLANHFTRHGDYFTDGQIMESTRLMGTGKHERARRVVYQWSFARSKRDDKAINAQIARAEKVAAGKAPLARTRFLKVTGATKELDQATIDRARQLAGLKGYVTNLDPAVTDGAAVIAAYHQLWQVEASFRMTKSDLRARPVFHHERDAIEAHLTVVFAALAVSRDLQDRAGVTIKRLVQTLRTARSATIEINGQRITLEPELTGPAHAILQRLQPGH